MFRRFILMGAVVLLLPVSNAFSSAMLTSTSTPANQINQSQSVITITGSTAFPGSAPDGSATAQTNITGFLNSMSMDVNLKDTNTVDSITVPWTITNSDPGQVVGAVIFTIGFNPYGITITGASTSEAGYVTTFTPTSANFNSGSIAHSGGMGIFNLVFDVPDLPSSVAAFELSMVAATPEPTGFALGCIGLVAMGGVLIRRRRSKPAKTEATEA